jgi:hypothetical protein
MWKNILGVLQATDDKMVHAGYRRLNIYTLGLCITRFCTATMVARTHLSVTLYLHCLSCTFCIETVYELGLLPYNTASETFLYNWGTMGSVDWIFVIGVPACPWLGEFITLDETFYDVLFKQEVVAAPVTSKFSSLLHSSRRPLLEI